MDTYSRRGEEEVDLGRVLDEVYRSCVVEHVYKVALATAGTLAKVPKGMPYET